jgi:hypothetical protein
MLYALTTTAKEVYAPQSDGAIIRFSAGNFSTAVSIYIRPVNTKKPWVILNAAGNTDISFMVPHGTQLEAYTDAGTADLAVLKACC